MSTGFSQNVTDTSKNQQVSNIAVAEGFNFPGVPKNVPSDLSQATSSSTKLDTAHFTDTDIIRHTANSSSSSNQIPPNYEIDLAGSDVEWTEGYERLKSKRLDGVGEDDLSESNRNNSDSEAEEPEYHLPDDFEDLNLDVLSSLPSTMKKQIIEELRRKERMKSRSNYLPVADNPILYSQTQLANFLNTR